MAKTRLKTFSASKDSQPGERRLLVEEEVNAWLEENPTFHPVSTQVVGVQEDGRGTIDFAVFITYEILEEKAV